MSFPSRVFIVDADVSARDAVRGIADDMDVACEEFDSGENFLAAYDASCPGCLVAEFSLPGISGFKLQEQLAADGFPLPTLFITHHANTRRTVRAMQHGALTVLDKPATSHDLREALQKAICCSQLSYGIASAHKKFRARLTRLSRLEQNVLPLLVAAMSNKQIARRLDLSKPTVKAARRRIFKKTRTSSVTELVQMTREASINGKRQTRMPEVWRQDAAEQASNLDQRRSLEGHASGTLRAELVGGIIHEISQPLQSIASFSAFIEDALQEGPPLDADRVQEWNQIVSRSARLAIEIIERFRAIVTDQHLPKKDEALEEIVHESMLMLQCLAEDNHVNIQFEPQAVTVWVDRVQIQQVVINLLMNAIESAAQNPIHDRYVAVEIVRHVTDSELIVTDNGIGIRESEVPHIFESFVSSKEDGLGLGLATSKRIVESHGGQLWYRPNHPRGAAFHVRLPLTK